MSDLQAELWYLTITYLLNHYFKTSLFCSIHDDHEFSTEMAHF